MRRTLLAFSAASLLVSICGASAQQVEVPIGRGPNYSVPGGGRFFTDRYAVEQAREWVQEELEKAVDSELGRGSRDFLGPDRVVLDRIWAVCPQTFFFLRNLPERARLQIVKEVVANARTRWLLAGGFQPRPVVPSLIELRPLGPEYHNQLRDDLCDHGICPDPGTDTALLKVAKIRFLVLSAIPAGLHSVLTQEMDDGAFLRAVEILASWPSLGAAVLELPPSLRAHTIERLNLDSYTKADFFSRPWTADEATRRRLTEFVTEIVREERIWPGTLGELAKKLKGRMVALREIAGPRRLRCVTARKDASTIQSFEVPFNPWEFFGIEKRVVAKDFERLLGASRADQPVLFLGGARDYSTHDLLRGWLTARSFDDSLRFADLHVENFRQLVSRDLAPARTVLFNLIPESRATIRRAGLPGSERRWQRARQTYDEFARRKGLIVGDGTSREKLLATLREGVLDTIVIVAHGESDGIFLADGSKLSVEDILDFPALDSARKPLVVLVSCAAGRFEKSLRSMAQALLLRGRACAVLAPTRKIPVLGGTIQFLERLLGPGKRPAATAFRHLSSPWQLYVEWRDGVVYPREHSCDIKAVASAQQASPSCGWSSAS